LRPLGLQCIDIDTANVGPHGELAEYNDLSSDQLWEVISRDLQSGRITSLWFGTPCTTFSKAREVRPGPPPLRDMDHLYGLPKASLTTAQYEQVRLGTYHALKTAELATEAHRLGVPFAIENPEPWEGHVSMFLLPEFKRLAGLPEVRVSNFDQCMVGAETTKPTRILYYKLPLSSLDKRCNHQKQWWNYTDWQGKPQRRWGAHPPLAQRKRGDGTPATAAAAVYPTELNRVIAEAIGQAVGPSGDATPVQDRVGAEAHSALPPAPAKVA
jgi:hypothetical protein